MQRRTINRRVVAGALVAALAFAGAACGDDDDDTTDETTSTTGDDGGATGDDAAFCETNAELTFAFNSAEGPDPEAAGAQLDDAEATAPEELTEEVAAAAAAARAALGGDDSALQTDEVAAAFDTIDQWAFDNCGAETGQISTVDYGFVGIPEELPSGLNIVEVNNEGAEIHEIVVLRRNEGVTQSFEEIFGLGEEAAQELVTQAGFAFIGEPGDREFLYADLEPGDYVAACFIPQGATDFAALEALGEDAPPHFTLGMVSEFTVAG